jgi:bifunctional DNase/RNase
VEVEQADGTISEVDARRSDAINLALLADATIRLDASILAAASGKQHGDFNTYPDRASTLAEETRTTLTKRHPATND